MYPSLRELWIWNDGFAGALPIPNSNSTNLTSVEAFYNAFVSADFSGQTNLDHVFIENNYGLTNINLTGCVKLRQLEAGVCNLSQAMSLTPSWVALPRQACR